MKYLLSIGNIQVSNYLSKFGVVGWLPLRDIVILLLEKSNGGRE